MFFDTNVIINFLNPDGDSYIEELYTEYVTKKEAYMSSIAYAEVLAFSDYTDFEADNLALVFKKYFKIIKPTNKMFDLAAKIARLQKQKTGKKLKLTDAIIAATAIEKNIPLLTLDRENFKNVEGLSLI